LYAKPNLVRGASFPWPAVGKRELWERPFQACTIARCRLRSEPDNQNAVISFVISRWLLLCFRFLNVGQGEWRLSKTKFTFRMRLFPLLFQDGYSYAFVFRTLVKGNEDWAKPSSHSHWILHLQWIFEKSPIMWVQDERNKILMQI